MKKRIMLVLVILVLLFVYADMVLASPWGSLFKNGAKYADDISRSVFKKTDDAARVGLRHADDIARIASTYGDDVAEIAGKYGDDAIRFLGAHGDEGARVIRKYGDDFFSLSSKNRARLVSLEGKYPKNVIRKAVSQGDEGVKALARGSFKSEGATFLRRFFNGAAEFVKKHPFGVIVTGIIFWFREAITTTGTFVVKLGTWICGGMGIVILTGVMAGMFAFAVKTWIFALRVIRGVLHSREGEQPDNNNAVDNMNTDTHPCS